MKGWVVVGEWPKRENRGRNFEFEVLILFNCFPPDLRADKAKCRFYSMETYIYTYTYIYTHIYTYLPIALLPSIRLKNSAILISSDVKWLRASEQNLCLCVWVFPYFCPWCEHIWFLELHGLTAQAQSRCHQPLLTPLCIHSNSSGVMIYSLN